MPLWVVASAESPVPAPTGWAGLVLTLFVALFGAGGAREVLKWLAERRVQRDEQRAEATREALDAGVDFERLRLADEAELRRWLFDQVKSQQAAIQALQDELAKQRAVERGFQDREDALKGQIAQQDEQIAVLEGQVASLRAEVARLRRSRS